MHKIGSFPKVWELGHKSVVDTNAMTGAVFVQEKIDGSQFSFAIIDGELSFRTKNRSQPDKSFNKAIEAITAIEQRLRKDVIYRGEYLARPRQNRATYGRVPPRHVIGYDVQYQPHKPQQYMNPIAAAYEFARLGMMFVPLLWYGPGETLQVDTLKEMIEGESVLGGAMEGVVIKNYNAFTDDGKVVMQKFVSPEFKESHLKSLKVSDKEFVEAIGEALNTDARLHKAVQTLRDSGELTGTTRDISSIMRIATEDVRTEEEAEIKQMLFDHFIKRIVKCATRGFPEKYKESLDN